MEKVPWPLQGFLTFPIRFGNKLNRLVRFSLKAALGFTYGSFGPRAEVSNIMLHSFKGSRSANDSYVLGKGHIC